MKIMPLLRLGVILSLTLLTVTSAGCVMGYGKHKETSFLYVRLGDQNITLTEEGLSQTSEGKVPSGFFGLLEALIQ